MSKRKSIDKMSYDELQKRKDELLFERFLGIILLTALLLGILLLIMLKEMSILDNNLFGEYIMWNLSAYALIAMGALGIIQILLSTIDYHRCLSNIRKNINENSTSDLS